MFIEVYTIPIQEWNKPTAELKIPENRRLIAVDGISVKYSTKSPNRAEIRLRDGKELTVVGDISASGHINTLSSISASGEITASRFLLFCFIS